MQCTVLLFNETQMNDMQTFFCKAAPWWNASEALGIELVRIDLLFNKRERNDCFSKFR